jgi:hypothetical protein
VTFENDVGNNGVVPGNVAFGIGSVLPCDFANSLVTAMRAEQVLGHLRADLVFSSTYLLHLGTATQATVYVTTPNQEDDLTLTIVLNVGPTFVANATTWYDAPGEEDQWRNGFPQRFQVTDWGDGEPHEFHPENGPPAYFIHIDNVDGANFLEFNSWDWNPLSLNRNRGNAMVMGTVAAPTANNTIGGRVGQNAAVRQPTFDEGAFDFWASDQNESDLNRWLPPEKFRPLSSAGTIGNAPINQTQYRLYVFHLHDREKIPTRHHGEGQ